MIAKVWPVWILMGATVLCGTESHAADVAALLKPILDVGPEGRGNAAAAPALQKLSEAEPQSIPAILAAFDGANPFAVNYLRNAVESIAERAFDKKGKLPAADLEKFLLNTEHDPRARCLAFDLLTRVDDTARARLIPGMLNDPSVELRRESVQRLIDQGIEKLEKKQNDEAKVTFQNAMQGARDEDQIKDLVKRLGDLGEKVDLPRHFGFIQNWRLLGPFDSTGSKGFNVPYPPETELKLDGEFIGKDGAKIQWTEYTTTDDYGVVDLNKAQGAMHGVASYAVSEFISPKSREIEIRLGTSNAWKVWLNGKLLFARDEYHRGERLDQYRMNGTLKEGKNVVLVKVCQNEQTEEWAQKWQFKLRICDAAGTAILSADRQATAQNSAARSPVARATSSSNTSSNGTVANGTGAN